MKRLIILLLLLITTAIGIAEDLDQYAMMEFGDLDELGRATYANAFLSADGLDTKRGSLSKVIPTGYDERQPDGMIWDKCHLIAAQLTWGTGVAENIVTGSRQMNSAMRPTENRIAKYLRNGGHVLYHVSPYFREKELVCRGVNISVYSMETDELRFSGFLENTQEGVSIDYLTGETGTEGAFFILNTQSKRFHKPECGVGSDMRSENRESYHGSRTKLVESGYSPCQNCKP